MIITTQGDKTWKKWDLESGVCPYGHLIAECTHIRKNGYPECRWQRNKKLFESGVKVKAQPEYRCKSCRAPLFAGLHIFGMECNG
jgi:hypothetical protein